MSSFHNSLFSSSGPLPIQQDYSGAYTSMIQTKRSVAEDMLQPSRLSFTDEPRKLYIGRIPKGATDDYMEKLLRCCGDLKSWKRSRDASGDPKAFGFAEFDNLEAVFAVLKFLNNTCITADGTTSRILVKCDEKATQFLTGWVEIKKEEWFGKQVKLGIKVDIEDLEQKEALGEILPYEKELIKDFDEVSVKIEILLQREDVSDPSQARLEAKQDTGMHEGDPF